MILKFRLQRVDFLCGETCNIQYVFDSESFGFHLAGIVELTGTVPVSTLSGKNFEIRKNVTKFAA